MTVGLSLSARAQWMPIPCTPGYASTQRKLRPHPQPKTHQTWVLRNDHHFFNSFHGLIFLRGYFRFNLDGFIGDELRGLIDALIVRELSFALLRSNPDHLVGGHSSQVSV